MLLDEKTLVTLQQLGLTYYGARAYAMLVLLGPSNATRISAESEVPRTKVYDVLKRLEAEGWINAERTRPITYTARYPKDIIEERKAAFISEADKVSNELSMMYDKVMDKENPKVWLLRGMDNIIPKTMDMMGRAKKSIMMLGALYSPQEIEQIKKQLLAAKRKGLNVRVISRPHIKLKDGDLDIVRMLTPFAPEITGTGPAHMKYVITDDRELLIMFSRVEGDVTDIDNTIAIWIPNASVASYMASVFNEIGSRNIKD
jgi:sugar-specific transcriptional regulator TrmB